MASSPLACGGFTAKSAFPTHLMPPFMSCVTGATAKPQEIDLLTGRFAELLLGDDMSGGGKGVCTALGFSNAITSLSEIDLMGERFAKLLLGEDMSGGGKGVSAALAISNAITNLSASIFGELWKLEHLAPQKKAMRCREMEWLLCTSDSTVELVPSIQQFPGEGTYGVMASQPHSDLYLNLPALKEFDAMLFSIIDGFHDTDFWYVDRGIVPSEGDGCDSYRSGIGFCRPSVWQEKKLWLPCPKVPPKGLSEEAWKRLQQCGDCTNQILKAAWAINSNVLAEMETPSAYLETLPKSGKTSIGDIICCYITADNFSPECLLDCLGLSSEHHTLEVTNQIEAAVHIWRLKDQKKHPHKRKSKRKSWGGKVKGLVADGPKFQYLAELAETLLPSVRLCFPGLPQTALDMNKILYNMDIENDKFKLELVQSVEGNSGLRVQNQKLSEEVSYAKELASAAAVELKILAGEVTKLSIQNAKLEWELLAARQVLNPRSSTGQTGSVGHRKYSEKQRQGRRSRVSGRESEVPGVFCDDFATWDLDPKDLKMELQARKREAALGAALIEKDIVENAYRKQIEEGKQREAALENDFANMWVLVSQLMKENGARQDLKSVAEERQNVGEYYTNFAEMNDSEYNDLILDDGQTVDLATVVAEIPKEEPLVARLKGVGQSILESSSRAMVSLALNIMARIDDVLYVDDAAKSCAAAMSISLFNWGGLGGLPARKRMSPSPFSIQHSPYASPFATPTFCLSPLIGSPGKTVSPSKAGSKVPPAAKLGKVKPTDLMNCGHMQGTLV